MLGGKEWGLLSLPMDGSTSVVFQLYPNNCSLFRLVNKKILFVSIFTQEGKFAAYLHGLSCFHNFLNKLDVYHLTGIQRVCDGWFCKTIKWSACRLQTYKVVHRWKWHLCKWRGIHQSRGMYDKWRGHIQLQAEGNYTVHCNLIEVFCSKCSLYFFIDNRKAQQMFTLANSHNVSW